MSPQRIEATFVPDTLQIQSLICIQFAPFIRTFFSIADFHILGYENKIVTTNTTKEQYLFGKTATAVTYCSRV